MFSFFRRMNVLLLISTLMMVGAADAKQLISGDKACDSIPNLKRAYLECERSVHSGYLSTGAIAYCSKIYYDLKDLAFDGDFAKIRSWYEMSTSLESLGSAMIVGPRNSQPCS